MNRRSPAAPDATTARIDHAARQLRGLPREAIARTVELLIDALDAGEDTDGDWYAEDMPVCYPWRAGGTGDPTDAEDDDTDESSLGWSDNASQRLLQATELEGPDDDREDGQDEVPGPMPCPREGRLHCSAGPFQDRPAWAAAQGRRRLVLTTFGPGGRTVVLARVPGTNRLRVAS